jgi:hypothetical protein
VLKSEDLDERRVRRWLTCSVVGEVNLTAGVVDEASLCGIICVRGIARRFERLAALARLGRNDIVKCEDGRQKDVIFGFWRSNLPDFSYRIFPTDQLRQAKGKG